MIANTSRVATQEIDADFLSDVLELITRLPATLGTFFITCGWRSQATELAGYHAWLADPTKPKYTNPANSAHVGGNFADGCARAVDVTLVRGGVDIWDVEDPGWQALLEAVRAHPRLHSLESIGDYDHIEKLHWQADKIAA